MSRLRPIALLCACAVLAAVLGGMIEGIVANVFAAPAWFAALSASVGLWLCALPLFVALAGLGLFGWRTARRFHARSAQPLWASLTVLGFGLAGLSAWVGWGSAFALERLKDVSLVTPILSLWVVFGAAGLVVVARLAYPLMVRPRRRMWIAALLGLAALIGVLVGPVRQLTKDMPLSQFLSLLGGVVVTMVAWRLLRARRLWPTGLAAAASLTLGAWGVVQYARFAEVRQPVLARRTLARAVGLKLRKGFDRDGDGRSAWFGGGDCDDTNPAIHPGAFDIPDNGIDEDCDGVPLSLAAQPAPPLEVHHPRPAHIDKRWNLLFVSVDTVRADRLSLYGHDRPTSPRLDALAQNGLVFERAYTPVTNTRLAIPAFFAGRADADLDAVQWARDRVLRPGNNLLFERLRAAGWRTEASLSTQLRDGMWFGPGWGFDVYAGFRKASLRKRSVPTLVADVKTRLTRLKAGAQPWALWVHFLEPHEPYLAHAAHAFGDAPIDRYDAEIASVDTGLGRLVDHLKALGLADSTLIVYTSDHGEEFGEHGRRYHAKQVFEESVRVPWVIHVPGAPSVRAPAPVSLIDIPATLSNLMGLPPVPAYGGVSHVNLLDGAEPDWSRTVYVESPFVGFKTQAHQRGVIRWPYKVIVDPREGLEALYNLERDPAESQNLRFDEPKAWTELSGALGQIYQGFRARRLQQVLKHAVVEAPPKNLKGKRTRIAPGLTFLGYQVDPMHFPERTVQRLRMWIRTDGEKRPRIRMIMHVYDARGTRIRKQNTEPFLDVYPSQEWPAGKVMEISRMLRFSKRYAYPLKVTVKLMAKGRTIWGPTRVATMR